MRHRMAPPSAEVITAASCKLIHFKGYPTSRWTYRHRTSSPTEAIHKEITTEPLLPLILDFRA